jgi:peptide/nickel transport system substrate-binding protein
MIITRTTRLRLRRHLRRSKRQVGDIGEQAEEHLERHFIKRLSRLYEVRRFVLTWLGLLILLSGLVVVQTRSLSGYYQELRPVSGGIYSEGIVGSFTNANPLFAAGAVDKTVSQLIFSGLLKYDENGKLVGDVAESWSVDESGRRYTVKIRQGLLWHDGRVLTANDVVFTYKLIQNPDVKSPLFSSWQGVVVSAPDPSTVTFVLPNALTSFPHSLTNGLVPEHIVKSIEPGQLRSASFNTAEPIGSGPFKWETVEVSGSTPEDREEQVGLVPNDKYYAGVPKIQRYIIRAFRDEKRLLKSFENKEVNAIVGLTNLPDTLSEDSSVRPHSIPLSGAVMVFFKNTHDQLKDVKVRQALVRGVDTHEIVAGLGFPVITVDSPFLRQHISYDPGRTQLATDKVAANQLLDEAGWVRGENGMRSKDNQPLAFHLYAQNNSEFTYVMQELQKQWRELGVMVTVDQPTNDEFQPIVAFHNYDALLYGISLGPDPDIYAYWHSTQADARAANRLNFSEYSSSQADQGLEGGRTRTEAGLRAVKYQPFLDAWRNDAPALALYQPRFLYVVRGSLFNFNPTTLHSSADRLSNVHNWMIRQDLFDTP